MLIILLKFLSYTHSKRKIALIVVTVFIFLLSIALNVQDVTGSLDLGNNIKIKTYELTH